jgi:flagellar basal body-associated protein FliL
MRRRNSTKANLSSKRSSIRRYLLWVLLAILILAIVIPVAVMFGKKKKAAPPKSTILVPLYVYPAPGAWDAVLTAYATNTPPLSVTFS